MNTTTYVSVPCCGNLFTWKKKIRTHLNFERLDRAIVRNHWVNIYPESLVTHGQFTCSNHCPIFLTVASRIHRRKKFPFRFQNAWCQYQQLDTIVEKQWTSQVQGTRMFNVSQKLRTTK